MFIFRVAGIILISLGVISGIVLFISPFGVEVQGSVFTFWLLYLLCYVGGFILYALGSPDSSAEEVMRTASGMLIIIGLMSAISIFLDKVGILKAEGTFSLWLLFIISNLAGTIGIFFAEAVKRKKNGEVKAEFEP
ncbi:MAG: hypothetical protein VST71_04570 [Nitrospirota bacterium]|nr:hypothetical protein [Nitrospirota bacterium]